jgi:hypothetical protein
MSYQGSTLTGVHVTEHALSQWSSRYLESMEGLKDLRIPLRLPTMLRQAGFVDVESRMIQLSTCAWSSGSHDPWYLDLPRVNADATLAFRAKR